MIRKVKELIAKVPGHETFGGYRFLPVLFFMGAALEYTMIHWKPNGHNFYKTFKEKQVHRIALKQLRLLGELEGIDESALEV